MIKKANEGQIENLQLVCTLEENTVTQRLLEDLHLDKVMTVRLISKEARRFQDYIGL